MKIIEIVFPFYIIKPIITILEYIICMKKLAKFFAVLCAVAITIGGCGASNQGKTEDKCPGTAKDGNELKIEKASINLHNDIEKGKYKVLISEELKKQ